MGYLLTLGSFKMLLNNPLLKWFLTEGQQSLTNRFRLARMKPFKDIKFKHLMTYLVTY